MPVLDFVVHSDIIIWDYYRQLFVHPQFQLICNEHLVLWHKIATLHKKKMKRRIQVSGVDIDMKILQ